jgi:tRNA U34 2-thiouridine synthase MnmA/TrmU
VIQKSTENNSITVGPETALELYHSQCTGKEWQPILPGSPLPQNTTIKLRYRQIDEPGIIEIH